MNDHSSDAAVQLQRNAQEHIAGVAKYFGLSVKKFAELSGLLPSQASRIMTQNPERLSIAPLALAALSKMLTHVSIHEMHFKTPKSVRLPKTMNLMAIRMEAADAGQLKAKREEWKKRFPWSDYIPSEQTFSDLYRERVQEQADDACMTPRRYCSLDRLLETDDSFGTVKINGLMQKACQAWKENLPYTPSFYVIYLMAENSNQPLDYFMAPNYIETGCDLLYKPLDMPKPVPVEKPDTIRVLSDYLNMNEAGRLELFTAVCSEL